MPSHRDRPLVPRNGHALVVGIIARISGCQNQKELSLEDQVDHAKQVITDLYQGPVEYRIISTKGKGERLDRPELVEVKQLLRTREVDILVAEDIGRVVRGTEAVRLCGIAVDHGTRVLAPNDCIDTAEDTWEEDVISACRDHVGHNAHTSKRLKHKLMNRFLKFGGATPVEVFGYIKPQGARTFEDWQKDPVATPIYQEWFRRLRESLNCSAVADWLNEREIKPGKYCRRKTWNGAMVRRLTRNPLLKGMPGRGFHHTVKHHETGRRVSVKNPKGPQFREYPALAHIDPAVWDEVNALLDARNARYRRKPVGGRDPLTQVPRKRTRFPGQHALAGYCGRHCVWGGNGMTENLMCSGAREWACWNSIGFSGSVVAQKLVEAVTVELYKLNGFDDQFRDLVRQARYVGGSDQSERWVQLERDEQTLAQHKEHLLEAIATLGLKPMFAQKVAELEAAERELAKKRRTLETLRTRPLDLPDSIAQVRQLLEERFQELAVDSLEFGEFLRLLVPQFHVYLVRLCDGGHLLPRARIEIALSSVIPDAKHAPGLGQLLKRELTLDLFAAPQRERIMTAPVEMDHEPVRTDFDNSGGLHETPKQLLWLQPLIATQPLGQPMIAPVGDDRQNNVQIDVQANLAGQAIQVEDVHTDSRIRLCPLLRMITTPCDGKVIRATALSH